jgi:peptidyl-tRNA hydrolase, PTH1 family
MPGIRLIAGLGNPGRDYAATRHNAGYWWMDRLAELYHVQLRPESKFHAECCRHVRDGADLLLLKPVTYMNASGRAVAAAARFYRIPTEEILVVHDELDLPPGTVRLKKGGGHGGHNGLKDVNAALDDGAYWRLRIGIGHPGDKSQVVDYVLHAPSAAERDQIEAAIARSLSVVPALQTGAFEAVMHKLHTRAAPEAG